MMTIRRGFSLLGPLTAATHDRPQDPDRRLAAPTLAATARPRPRADVHPGAAYGEGWIVGSWMHHLLEQRSPRACEATPIPSEKAACPRSRREEARPARMTPLAVHPGFERRQRRAGFATGPPRRSGSSSDPVAGPRPEESINGRGTPRAGCTGSRVLEDPHPGVAVAGEDQRLVAFDVGILVRVVDRLHAPEVVAGRVQVAANLDQLAGAGIRRV